MYWTSVVTDRYVLKLIRLYGAEKHLNWTRKDIMGVGDEDINLV